MRTVYILKFTNGNPGDSKAKWGWFDHTNEQMQPVDDLQKATIHDPEEFPLQVIMQAPGVLPSEGFTKIYEVNEENGVLDEASLKLIDFKDDDAYILKIVQLMGYESLEDLHRHEWDKGICDMFCPSYGECKKQFGIEAFGKGVLQ